MASALGGEGGGASQLFPPAARKIRMQPLLSEPRSCLPLSQQPLGRWQGDGWYLQRNRTALSLPPLSDSQACAHTRTHRERARGNISRSHTRGANKHTPTPSLSFFLQLPFTLLNTHAYDYLCNTPPLSLLPLATEPISVVSGGMESSQAWKQWRCSLRSHGRIHSVCLSVGF